MSLGVKYHLIGLSYLLAPLFKKFLRAKYRMDVKTI